MKNLLLIFVLVTTSVFGQDVEMFNFINLYRKQNGKKELKLSESLSTISVEQNKKIVADDTLSHSHKTSEIAVMGKNLPSTMETKTNFFMFVESLGITYKEPRTDEEAVKYTKLYCLFLFNESPKHKDILLGDYTNIGFDLIIENVKFKSNEVVVNGQVVKFNKIKSHYTVDFYFVTNFN